MGLVAIVAVLLAGMSINNENLPADQKVTDWKGFERSIEKTVDDVKARDKFVSFKLND